MRQLLTYLAVACLAAGASWAFFGGSSTALHTPGPPVRPEGSRGMPRRPAAEERVGLAARPHGSSGHRWTSDGVWRNASLPPVLFTNSSLYLQDDCASSWVKRHLTVVVVVLQVGGPLLHALLQSLHLAPELRTCPKLLLHRPPARTGLEAAGTACPTCQRLREEVGQQRGSPFYHNTRLRVVPPDRPLLRDTPQYIATPYVLLLEPRHLLVHPVRVPACLRYMAATGRASLPLPLEEAHDDPGTGPTSFPAFHATNQLALLTTAEPLADAPAGYPFEGVGVYRRARQSYDAAYVAAVDVRRYRYPKRPRHFRGSYDELVEPHACRDQGCFWRCRHVDPLVHRNLSAYWPGDCASRYVAKRLTIIITAAPIPSNPSTTLLTWLLQSLYQMPELRGCRRLLMLDRPRPSLPEERQARYAEFLRRVHRRAKEDPLFHLVEVVQLQEHGHLTGSIRAAMARVATPYVLLLQQDLPFARPADMLLTLRTLEANPRVKHVRFNTHPTSPAGFDVNMDTDVPEPSFVPLVRTEGWSDQNHMSSAAYYRTLVLPRGESVPEARRKAMCRMGFFMECFMNKYWNEQFALLKNWSAVHEVFGTYVYGVPGERLYSLHVDGSEKHGRLSPHYLRCFDG
eukprot:EG_transcript_5191